MKTLQTILTIVGGATLTLGFVIALSADLSMFTRKTEYVHSDYLTPDTCVTCHSDSHVQSMGQPQTRTITQSLEDPTVVVVEFATNDDDVRNIDISESNRPYALREDGDLSETDQYQQYMMRTDTGYAVLPRNWNVSNSTWQDTNQQEVTSIEDCESCHVAYIDEQARSTVLDRLTCETCHRVDVDHINGSSPIDEMELNRQLSGFSQ